jgi:hypothetical protein
MRCLLALVLAAAACGGSAVRVDLGGAWPANVEDDYDDVTDRWTRTARMRSTYQEALELAATFKSPEWRFAHAAKDAESRGLAGPARDQLFAQARAEDAGPYEFQLMVTTWDRRENDLDRGKKSVWRVRLLDEQGMEIEPIEIIKDKRPGFVVRNQFPAHGEFATAYIVRFPRTQPLLGPTVKQLRLRLSSERGGVELTWLAPGA